MRRNPGGGGGFVGFLYRKMGKMELADKDEDSDQDRDRRRSPTDQESGQNGQRHDEDRQRSDDMATLEREFVQSMAQLKNSLGGLQFREKSVATEWIQKLLDLPGNVTEARARNDILSYLVRSIDKNVFNQEPFNRPPPYGNLSMIQAVMPIIKENDRSLTPPSEYIKSRYIADLFKNCYDSGNFLSELPVPRDGAFAIFHMRPNL